ncbi:MAG: exodeoxyribonuclease III [Proteobacteria bacterium]|nr:exodeoxyribonuclease III [Pseudomonadota bacterium]MDA1332057.1 exodeoxyribonuclease III [Pseudomonadota bacterium]
MGLVTWNVNSLKVRLPHLQTLLQKHAPSVVCLQETKTEDQKFPKEDIEQLGYSVIYHGQKTYNGVAILSLKKMSDMRIGIPGFHDDQARVIAATSADGVRVINVYVPNGESIESAKFQYKLNWLRAFVDQVRREVELYSSIAILGDFNIAPKENDVYDAEAFRERVLCTTQERDLFQELLSLGFNDGLDGFLDGKERFTWWDYRMNAFKRKLGLRIDHILMSENTRQKCVSVEVLKSFRKLERPSDHAPVIANFN